MIIRGRKEEEEGIRVKGVLREVGRYGSEEGREGTVEGEMKEGKEKMEGEMKEGNIKGRRER